MTLEDKLVNELKDIKLEYLTKTEEWAKKQVEINIQRAQDYFKLGHIWSKEDRNKYYKEQKFAYTNSTNFDRVRFVEKAIKHAEQQFEGMILKLAFRIKDKAMDVDSLKIDNTHIGVNIDTIITDKNDLKVTANTIIASGPVQRPHYRYLIR